VQTSLAHLQINVDQASLPFYKALLTFLGWQPIMEMPGMIGLGTPVGPSLWFIAGAKSVANDYDGPGVNHIAIGAESIADVDAAASYLRDHSMPALFGTPCHRPEFASDADHTYYQVMFESPDRVLFEVVYTGLN
jgi:catechol 2,3-dioxygenase-like lactoylglutathione lyase family enzyme